MRGRERLVNVRVVIYTLCVCVRACYFLIKDRDVISLHVYLIIVERQNKYGKANKVASSFHFTPRFILEKFI